MPPEDFFEVPNLTNREVRLENTSSIMDEAGEGWCPSAERVGVLRQWNVK
jgi:hypothetical protein